MQDLCVSRKEKIEHLAFVLLKCPLCDNPECPLLEFKKKRLIEKIAILESLTDSETFEIMQKCLSLCGLKSLNKPDDTAENS